MHRNLNRRSRPLTALLAVAVAAGSTLFTVTGAGAQSSPSDPTVTTTTPTTEPVRTGPPERTIAELVIIDQTLKLYKMKADLAGIDHDLADVTAKLADAEKALAETETKLATARGQLADLRAELQGRAAVMYQRQGDRLGMTLAVNRVVDLSAGSQSADSVAAVDNHEIDRLEGVIDDLVAEHDKRSAVREDLAAGKSKLDARHADLQASVDKNAAEVDKLGGVPVLGAPTLTGPELAAWFKSTGQRAHLSGTTTIDELADIYVQEGLDENVRGDLAFAQAVLETGSFGHAVDNNYSGIGACDSCTSELLFPTPRDGVRAQIQFLLNYADPNSRAANLEHPPDPTLYSPDPAKAAFMFDTFFGKGDAPVWNIMGNGNWATDPLYAGKVLSIFGKMLEFKAQQPKTP
jgi:flagellum-specific peptidoglycan hydrolase FlgJ